LFWVIIWLSTSADWQAECFTTTLPTLSNPLHFSRLPVLAVWVSGWLKSNSIHLHPVALLLHRNSIVAPICAHDGYTKNFVIRTARFNTLDTLRIEQPPRKMWDGFPVQLTLPCSHPLWTLSHCHSLHCCSFIILILRWSSNIVFKKNRHRPVEWDWLDKLQRLPRRSRLNQTPWPLPLKARKRRKALRFQYSTKDYLWLWMIKAELWGVSEIRKPCKAISTDKKHVFNRNFTLRSGVWTSNATRCCKLLPPVAFRS